MPTDAKYLYLVMLDVDSDMEELFNDLYNNEHIPALLRVPGVLKASRYETSQESLPKYLAVYELESPHVIDSAAWQTASNSGEWPQKVRPHLKNRSSVTYKCILPGD